MSIVENMAVMAGWLRFYGWENTAGLITGPGVAAAAAGGGATIVQAGDGPRATRTYGTYTSPQNPDHTIHLTPAGDLQVNLATPQGTIRLLVVRVLAPVAVAAALAALNIIDLEPAQTPTGATEQDTVVEDTQQGHEAVSGPQGTPEQVSAE